MAADGDSLLTDRQAEVLRLREAGMTQRAVADELGTTASNVSAVERAATRNIEKARRTLEQARMIRAPAAVETPAGTPLDRLVEDIYEAGDAAGVRIDFCEPELYGHLFSHLSDALEDGQLVEAVEVGLTTDGDVTVRS